MRLKNDASLSSVRSSHDAEVRRLHDQLAESDNIRQQQIEQLRYEHAKQLEELHREMADKSEVSESTKRKFEREKNSLEAELTKALQDLVTVKIVILKYTHSHTHMPFYQLFSSKLAVEGVELILLKFCTGVCHMFMSLALRPFSIIVIGL